MLVNNEIGVIQPVAEIARLAHAGGALMLCDAVQGLGRVEIPEGPDLVAVSAHKIHGPKGIGGLVDAGGRRAGAIDPRRGAGTGPALGDAVAGAVRRASAPRPGWRPSAGPTMSTLSNCVNRGSQSLRTDWIINGSMTSAITAI